MRHHGQPVKLKPSLDPSCLFMLPANESAPLAGKLSAVGTVVGAPIFCVGTVGAVVGTVVGTVVFTIGTVDLYEMGLTPLNPILHSEQFLL